MPGCQLANGATTTARAKQGRRRRDAHPGRCSSSIGVHYIGDVRVLYATALPYYERPLGSRVNAFWHGAAFFRFVCTTRRPPGRLCFAARPLPRTCLFLFIIIIITDYSTQVKKQKTQLNDCLLLVFSRREKKTNKKQTKQTKMATKKNGQNF